MSLPSKLRPSEENNQVVKDKICRLKVDPSHKHFYRWHICYLLLFNYCNWMLNALPALENSDYCLYTVSVEYLSCRILTCCAVLVSEQATLNTFSMISSKVKGEFLDMHMAFHSVHIYVQFFRFMVSTYAWSSSKPVLCSTLPWSASLCW